MPNAYFSLGSNLGDRAVNLDRAIALLEDRTGRRARRSPTYRTESWGYQSDHHYFNCCLSLPTQRSPRILLRILQQVETTMGRTREGNAYHDRLIDIDLLLLGQTVVHETGLVIPHPRLAQRRFVLQPLADIAPDLVHPVLGRSISDLLAACPDSSEITPV